MLAPQLSSPEQSFSLRPGPTNSCIPILFCLAKLVIRIKKSLMTVQASTISNDFIWRRVHSLMGFWLVLYLIVHLITNSQAALWIGDDGSGFIKLVNSLETLPYLQVVETVLIGIPLLIHGVWGVKRAWTARLNSGGGGGIAPSMKYSRNRAFTWQRLTFLDPAGGNHRTRDPNAVPRCAEKGEDQQGRRVFH